ncbi:arabinosyltransferase domain-containing protein [Geodermatophilus sp. YIM 151500]|uniref:arabinosyltransferase domain-containing protein n=1 Tax=Geodermatophilus sp. YIM 151500 TaxID=2984531 RepID=UPI0021E4FE76|nr:arabinosyltransferase domain-containing protein [Geodermatophilus sp. YIM 151500]MCV2488562.1 arabinosyltransferase domain-containing protein [Geodermatophilus sp. YIM 151500]
MDVADRQQVEPAAAPRPEPARRRAGALLGRLAALLLALVAIGCAVALPLLPVRMSQPTVSWPQEPGRPESTMLQLTNQRPLALDVGFSCDAVRAAATDGGVVVSTLVPARPDAGEAGLLVTAGDGRLRIVNRDETLVDRAVPAGDCAWRILGEPDALTVRLDGREVAATATEDDVAGGPTVLPDVDVLATSIERLAAGDDLRVRIAVDNQFNTTPTPLKSALVAAALVAAVGCLLLLRLVDRRAGRTAPAPDDEPRRPRDPPALLLDAAVVGVMLLWLFLAPTSDDDGYYAAMARNAAAEGFVGNYYQLLNQSFTPFTWFYRVLGWWQQVGDSPVVLRVPALVAGVLTWVLLRRFVTRPGALPDGVLARRGRRLAAVVLLAATFLAWWLPYGMGMRPEAVVGLLALATLAGVLAGLRRRRLLPVGLALGAAGLAVACHPTGFVALAPLVAALPRLAALVGRDEGGGRRGRLGAATRTALLLAPGAFASAAAFADGSLNDFLRGQEIFLSVQDQDAWYDEFQRYAFLLSPIPMGSYARRTAVLLGLVALGWFLLAAVAARARRVELPLPLLLTGASLTAALLLLWFTPSKWTHHFGALSGLGPAFLTLFLVSAPTLARRLGVGRGGATPFLVVGSLVVAFALAFHGPNAWAYSWLPGVTRPNVPPSVAGVELGGLHVWALVAAAVWGVAALLRRRRASGAPAWPVAVPVLVLVFLGSSLTWLLAGFGAAAARTVDGYSPWADALSDPLARNCGAASSVRVFDVSAARPLPTAGSATAPASDAFVPDGGWWPPSPPPDAGDGIADRVWGSLAAPGGEARTGTVRTPWFDLPAVDAGEAVAVLVAGLLGDGNELRVEYAAAGSAEPEVVDTEEVDIGGDTPAWRTALLDVADARDAGAGLLRLVADDRTAGPGGWLAFTGPAVVPQVPLAEYLPDEAVVATAWQIAFLFPCQQQPVVRYGITEPVTHGIAWRPGPDADGLADNTWQVFRGGLFAPVLRTAATTELVAALPGARGAGILQVFRFDRPYPVAAYDVTVDRVVRPGWAGPPRG